LIQTELQWNLFSTSFMVDLLMIPILEKIKMNAGYYRYPTIFDETIVFACEDDLWTVHANGGVARRLTSTLGEASRPRFSPDGKHLAFVGREEGQSEIYVMPAEGGPTRRLTYLSGSVCLTAGWTPDSKIVFANNAGHWYLRFTHLYQVDLSGNAPEKLNFGLARAISYGPNGGLVIGRNTDEPARWKRYRGGTAGQIWIDVTGVGDFRPLVELDGNLTSPLWLSTPGSPGRIYFISDHEGVGNLYSVTPNGEDILRHTHHEDFYVRNANTDGKRIIYHAGADMFIYDTSNGQSGSVNIEFHSPRTQRSRKFVDPGRYLQEWSFHPQGQAVAATTRGKLFSFANWEGAVEQYDRTDEMNDANPPITGVRYRLSRWLADGKRLLAVTDEGGEERFVIFSSEQELGSTLLPDLDIGRPENIAVNPCKDQIVFSNHRYELVFLDLVTHEMKLIDRGCTARINGFCWSPDGEWVAYSISVSLQTQALKLWKSSTAETYSLTRPVLRDVAPAFDPNGKYLYFLSYRTFDPIYDNLHFDLSFPLGMKPYLLTLQKDLPSPFILKTPLEQECKEDSSAQDETPASASPAEPAEGQIIEQTAAPKKPQPVIQIDLDGIEDRLIAFPVSEGIYGRILGLDKGKVLYSRFPIQGTLNQDFLDDAGAKGTLLVYNFEDQKEETLVSGISDFNVSSNNKMMIYQSGSRLRVLKAGEKPNGDGDSPSRKTGWLDLSRLKVSVLPGAEWRQMFREAWRLQRDQFWTPDMSQIDWVSVHDRYLPLVDRLSSRSEFSDLMWEMQGELGTSHAYEYGGDYRPEPTYRQGFLGADFSYDPVKDAWQITHIYHGDSWNPSANSPLRQSGINILEGDYLMAINGRKLSRHFSPSAALVNRAGDEVTLTISPATDRKLKSDEETNTESSCTFTVKTLHSEESARYREWVEGNRAYVHQATGNRVGYLHIPDMMGWGFAEFHRGYLAEVDREGLIVDVRFNRGGHVSALLLEKLARRRLGYDKSRWGQLPSPYPPDSVIGPMVAITNEFTGSDGDIFSHGFKMMKLGALIGKRTWGGVIGIEPRHRLVDGTMTTQPEFSFFFNDVGWGVENYGTDPDIEVDITPQDYTRELDPQLDRAIQEIMQSLVSNPPSLPDFSGRPSLALPKLPKNS
jgi:tricorn protease